MTNPDLDSTHTSKSLALLALLIIGLCALVLLTLLHLALPFPFILDDEYRYSQLARHGLPLPGSSVLIFPVFLYSSTFSWVSRCGEGFLQCARFMNVLFLVASLLPIYRSARLFVDRKLAVVIAAFAIAAPVHTYTAYFMAETMYFFLFWIFVWFVLSHLRGDPLQLGSGMGAIGALLTLVKPQGQVLLGATTVFVLVLAIVRRRLYPLQWLPKVLIAVALAFFILRFGIGYVLAGREGLDLLGAYRGQVTPMANLGALPSQLADLLRVVWGHLAGLIFLFSVPIAICVCYLPRLAKPEPKHSSGADLAELSLFTTVVFGVFLVFFSKFTVDYAGETAYEASRIHARYYDFAFPLFLIITAAFTKSAQPAFVAGLRPRVIVAAVLVAGIVGAVLSIKAYTPIFSDDPELAWLAVSPWRPLFLGVVAVLLVGCWLVKVRIGAQGFFFVFFPLVAAVAGFSVTRHSLLGYQGTAYDFGPLVAKHLISPECRGRGVVLGEEIGALFRALFHLDSQAVQFVQVAPGAPIESGMIASDRLWALIVGQHEVGIPYASRIDLQGFSIVGLVPGVLAVASQPWEGSSINLTFSGEGPSFASGFYPFDSYCMWSMTESPEIELPVAVAGAVRLRLLAQGYGPNVNSAVTVRLGSSESHLTLAGSLQEVEVVLSPDVPSRLLRFAGLRPASPADLEGSPDRRKLGMCLRSLSLQSMAGKQAGFLSGVRAP